MTKNLKKKKKKRAVGLKVTSSFWCWLMNRGSFPDCGSPWELLEKAGRPGRVGERLVTARGHAADSCRRCHLDGGLHVLPTQRMWSGPVHVAASPRGGCLTLPATPGPLQTPAFVLSNFTTRPVCLMRAGTWALHGTPAPWDAIVNALASRVSRLYDKRSR